ncbi:hypothetical protein MMC08_008667 [Hypocenomyce scalaris]|nr:hypothetical protein [Hypocenomyce scalaris]
MSNISPDPSVYAKGMFSATIVIVPKLPMIALEEIDSFLESVTCSESTITLRFTREQYRHRAERAWASLTEFFIVTSNTGCNRDGQRAPYMISDFSFTSNETVIVFNA